MASFNATPSPVNLLPLGAGDAPHLLGVDGTGNPVRETPGSLVINPGVTGVAAPYVSLRDILRTTLSATGCTLHGDGTTDVQPKLMDIISSLSAWGGGRFHLNKDLDNGGRYKLGAALDLPANVWIYGDGDKQTELFAVGDHPVVQSIGTISSVQDRAGISRMLIRGGGRSNANAHGVKLAWSNRINCEYLRFHSCRNAYDFDNVWQCVANYLHADGGGTDQNYNGFYGHVTDPANANNAVIAHGCEMQNIENIGYLLRGFNGSKFTSCEAAGTGSHGWHLGVPDAGTEIVQWGHFSNILSDTTTGDSFRVEKGSSTAIRDFQINGLWLGNSGAHGLHIIDASGLQISGLIARSISASAVYLERSSRNLITSVNIVDFNQANASNPAVKLTDSSRNVFAGLQAYAPTYPASPGYTETGTSDYNKLSGVDLNAHALTFLGKNSTISDMNGSYAFQHRTSGQDIVGALEADTGYAAYLGLGTHAAPLQTSVRRTTTNQIELLTDSIARFRVGNGTTTAESVNTNLWPMKDYTTTVSALPASPDGSRATVTDSNLAYSSANIGTTVAGGGANTTPVIRIGGAWKIG